MNAAPREDMLHASLGVPGGLTLGDAIWAHGQRFFRIVLWLALLVGGNVNALASNAVSLVEGTETYPLGLNLAYFEDAEGQITLEDILSGGKSPIFKPNEKAVPNFGFTTSSYWFRLDITNQSSPVTQWLLESQYPVLDHINVYLVYPNKNIVRYRGGDALPFDQRAVKHRNVVFKVPLDTGKDVQIYINVRTESSLQLPLVLRSKAAFRANDHEGQHALGLYYGVLVAMLLYNLLIFLSIRDFAYLYSVWYIGGCMLFQMSLNGLAFEYLWPDYPSWGNKATPFFIGLSIVGIGQFTRALLETKDKLPAFDRMLRIMGVWGSLVMACALFATYSVAIKLGAVGALALVLVVVSTGTWALKSGIRQARYFMVAWSALIVGIGLYVLKTFGILPATTFNEYIMQISIAFAIVLLSFALAHRMRLLKEENEHILNEATETLERRVQDRTQELDEALLGLSKANNKLQELNHTDGLTGISNRAYFDEQFEFEWQRAMRVRSPLGLLMLDIDHFKRFNDTYGHLGGDACLKLVAQTVSQILKRPSDHCYRYGGEEFVTVLPQTDLEGSLFIAEAIRRAVEALDFTFEGKKIPVTISIGAFSMMPERDQSSAALISSADQGLYRAKRQGRNQVCTFNGPPAVQRP